MGYGTDESDMVTEEPVLINTLVTVIKLAASEAEYTAYGGNGQLVTDLASLLLVNSTNIKVQSTTESDDASALTIVYNIDIYD